MESNTITDDVSDCLCAKTMPAVLSELTRLRKRWPDKRIIMATTDVNNAYKNVTVAPDQAQKFCYTVEDVLVADFRLTFG